MLTAVCLAAVDTSNEERQERQVSDNAVMPLGTMHRRWNGLTRKPGKLALEAMFEQLYYRSQRQQNSDKEWAGWRLMDAPGAHAHPGCGGAS